MIGGDLRKLITSHHESGTTIPEERIIGWLGNIARGLEYLHANKVVHGDIKSTNILLDSEGRAKIADFGTMRILSHTKSRAQAQGGTTGSTSPEMCEGKPYGTPTDIWALGCVLYELCMLKVSNI